MGVVMRKLIVFVVVSVANILLASPSPATDYALRFNDFGEVVFPFDDIMHTDTTATIECWVRGDEFSLAGITPYIRWSPGLEDKSLHLTNDGNVAAYYFNSPWSISAAGVLPIDGEWHHLCSVRNSADSSFRLFVDGAKVAEALNVTGGVGNAEVPTKIGHWTQPATMGSWDIRNLRVSDHALYSGTFAPPWEFASEPGTVMLVHLDEGLGDYVYDDGPHQQVGTITLNDEFASVTWIPVGNDEIVFSDDFDTGIDPGWIQPNGGWAWQDGHIVNTTTCGFQSCIPDIWSGGPAYSDYMVSFDLQLSAGNVYIYIMASEPAEHETGQTGAYTIDTGAGDDPACLGKIWKVGPWPEAELLAEDSGAPFCFDPGVSYRIKFGKIGNIILYKKWPNGGPEPTEWNLQATDGDFSSGYWGIGFWNGFGTVDNFEVLGAVVSNFSPSVLGAPGTGLSGVTWTDCDQDGYDDLYLTAHTGLNQLLQNDGVGGFQEATPPTLAGTGSGSSTIWLDLHDTGLFDAYSINFEAPNKLFNNLGALGFIANTPPPLDDPGPSRGASAADFDLDGDLDIFVARSSAQPNLLVRNDGLGVYVDVSSGPFLESRSSLMGCWGDYDNDGDPDLYIVNWNSPNQLLRNDAGTFVDVATGPQAHVGNSTGATWGDFDNDGFLDLYVTCSGTDNVLLHNDSGFGFSDVTPPALADAGESNSPCMVDYDNNGWLDVYYNTAGGSNRIFHSASGVFVEAVSTMSSYFGNSTSAAWSDFDNDGDQDVFVADYDIDGTSMLLRNDLQNGNHWLGIDLYGTSSNRYGVGTRLRVVTGALSQIREVAIGSGTAAQHSLTAHFGLGAVDTVDSLVLRWPSGIVQTLVDVHGDQRLRIIESATSTDVSETPDRSVPVWLGDAVPSPFNPSTSITYLLSQPQDVQLDVYDLAGRFVRSLVNEQVAAGEYRVQWNGRDDSGNRVASGVYLYRLRAGEHVATKRMVLLK